MDDELGILENELKRLRPAAPSRTLLARVERELEVSVGSRPATPWRWLWIGALPITAVIAIVAVRLWPHTGGPGEVSLKPVAAENLLVSAQDEGVVTLDDGTQARRERRRYIDTITWRNPRTNASLIWSVPREEVLVVPISFQ